MMEAKIVNSSIYEQVTKNVANVFNKANFAELNREKVDDILYVVVYKEDSPRFGCIFGKIGNEWKCPFSAPYGYIEPLKKGYKLNQYSEEILLALGDYYLDKKDYENAIKYYKKRANS